MQAWRKCEDIGSWELCLNLLGFIGVITNATMVTMVGGYMSELVEAKYPDELGISNSIQQRVLSPRLWILTLIFEHFVMLSRIMVRPAARPQLQLAGLCRRLFCLLVVSLLLAPRGSDCAAHDGLPSDL